MLLIYKLGTNTLSTNCNYNTFTIENITNTTIMYIHILALKQTYPMTARRLWVQICAQFIQIMTGRILCLHHILKLTKQIEY